jgi:fido (protein-threonine AMPylation protein)
MLFSLDERSLYINPEFGILRNKFGLTNQESLDRAEANAVSAR